ncbi:hypothetical protein, partial [Sphingopyxis sp.]|uniref:hypothetical protein n=1 Tax=Sphingopyxis sp. TaxID=1908224 RepID=UPI0025F0A17F
TCPRISSRSAPCRPAFLNWFPPQLLLGFCGVRLLGKGAGDGKAARLSCQDIFSCLSTTEPQFSIEQSCHEVNFLRVRGEDATSHAYERRNDQSE